MTAPLPDRSLAARIERVECNLLVSAFDRILVERAASAFLQVIAGGVATYAGPGSPLNKIAGLGFAGPVAPHELQDVEARFARAGAPTQVELSSLADPMVGVLLCARGHRLVAFENVSGRALREEDARTGADDDDVAVRRDADFDTWHATIVEGFAAADSPEIPAHEGFARDVIDRALCDMEGARGYMRFVATIDGEPAGAAGLRIDDRIAHFCGASTLPGVRRRGVQAALLRARLGEAARAGAELAVVTTQPGSPSHANVHRAGFSLLYTRSIFVKEPATTGLLPPDGGSR